MTDVLTDISAWPVPLICQKELVGQAQRARALVHRGFQEAWQSAKDRILALLAMCVAEASTDGGLPWTVYVTGHSLGGAIATLCALHLKFSKCAPDPQAPLLPKHRLATVPPAGPRRVRL